MTLTTEPLPYELGKAAEGGCRGKKGRVSKRLVTPPHNSAPNLPVSVFFGTSGVPGDGCAEPSLTAARLSELWNEGARANACLNAGCTTPDECLMTGCARMRLADAIDFVRRHGPRALILTAVLLAGMMAGLAAAHAEDAAPAKKVPDFVPFVVDAQQDAAARAYLNGLTFKDAAPLVAWLNELEGRAKAQWEADNRPKEAPKP